MDGAEQFAALARQRAAQLRPDGGVGTLGEKTLHQVVKEWLQPSGSLREVPMGGVIVDALTDDGIQEVQTRGFYSLQKKLPALLDNYAVTVVHPLADRKWLYRVDPLTGEVSGPRRSPKRGAPWDAVHELIHLLPLLKHPNLRLRLLLMDLEEYRLQDDSAKRRRGGAVRLERIPLALTGEVWLCQPADYLQLLPPDLPEPFTRKQLRAAARQTERTADKLLAVLRTVGAVEVAGKQGRAILYRRMGSTGDASV